MDVVKEVLPGQLIVDFKNKTEVSTAEAIMFRALADRERAYKEYLGTKTGLTPEWQKWATSQLEAKDRVISGYAAMTLELQETAGAFLAEVVKMVETKERQSFTFAEIRDFAKSVLDIAKGGNDV